MISVKKAAAEDLTAANNHGFSDQGMKDTTFQIHRKADTQNLKIINYCRVVSGRRIRIFPSKPHGCRLPCVNGRCVCSRCLALSFRLSLSRSLSPSLSRSLSLSLSRSLFLVNIRRQGVEM